MSTMLRYCYEWIRPKIGPRDYARMVWAAVRKRPLVWSGMALVAAAGLVFGMYYRIAFNLTPSVPYSVLLVEKAQIAPGSLKRNELVAWRWQGGLNYGRGALFVKFVKGLPGDRVERRGASGRDYYVNGQYVGTAKIRSRFGDALEANRAQVVPPGHYYLFAPHRDSLDSRYAIVGYVPHAYLVGRAHVVF